MAHLTPHDACQAAIRAALACASLLLVPLIAMRFTDEVHWTALDFLAAGTLLFGALYPFALVLRCTPRASLRLAFGLALAGGLGLAWVNLAVGIIGQPDNVANLMYAGVLAIGVGGALRARLRTPGMARAMLGTALAMTLAGIVALWLDEGGAPGRMLAGHGLFAALFLASAALFQHAARMPSTHPR